MDQAKKKAGPADSLSHAEKQANKRRTHKVRRQQGKLVLRGRMVEIDIRKDLPPGQAYTNLSWPS